MSKKPLNQSFNLGYQLYAGEYPGDKQEAVARQKIQQMLAFGIRHFVDLTEEGELVPYAHLLPADVTYMRFPVRDTDIPSDFASVAELVAHIHRMCMSDDGYVYLHCWGGVGRTGTIAACYLAEQMEDPDYERALKVLRNQFTQMPKSAYRVTPENSAQRNFIRDYVQYIRDRRAQCLERVRDGVRGCLMAGAAGDALGYTVEFMRRTQIRSRYGANGITQFELAPDGKALVSDDTQMTLFTANGLLMGITRCCMRGIGSDLAYYTDGAYIDWYYTQTGKKKDFNENDFHYTWLRDLPQMAHRRAPGNTCLSACEQMIHLQKPQNDSKGCGGIMRVAPMGLLAAVFQAKTRRELYDPLKLAEQGAVIAKMTHLHPLGYLPAALMTLLIARLVPLTPDEAKEQIVTILHEAIDVVMRMEEPQKDKEYLRLITLNAIRLAQTDLPDDEAIELLGEGWTGDEAWAVSVYCALRHIDSMHDAIMAAVNHDGDSDSTGSVTGNIMGAVYGYEALKRENLFCPEGKEFEQTIELSDIILAIADDLFNGCCISEYSPINTPEQKQWYARYVEMKPAGIVNL